MHQPLSIFEKSSIIVIWPSLNYASDAKQFIHFYKIIWKTATKKKLKAFANTFNLAVVVAVITGNIYFK